MKRSLIVDTNASSCYFRTSVEGDARKALIQITERCNLHCAHCFVSSTASGADLRFDEIAEKVFPRLARARVQRVTLTGGEPFVHADIMKICALAADRGLPLGVCTNATQTSDEQISELARLENVHINVSLDGFRPESHGKFRGSVASDIEIKPALDAGQVVISDRYVQSSLVLQRLDGLPLEEIWRYNTFVVPPTISFYLQLAPETVADRLNRRRRLSRLERVGSPERELALYDDAFGFLARRGWHQIRVDCRGLARTASQA